MLGKCVNDSKMPRVPLLEVLDATCKDDKFPPENLTRKYMSDKWLCSKGEVNHMMAATFRLAKPIPIGRLDIGNAGSASVSVLVSRTGGKEFKELLPSITLRTEAECRNNTNSTGVQMLTTSSLREGVRHERWDIVRIICYQPYRRPDDDQYGLSFFHVFEAPSQSSGSNSVDKLKETAFRSSISTKNEVNFSNLSRAQKIMLANKTSPTSPVPAQPSAPSDGDDIFKATVISFLDANANIINSKSPDNAKSELIQKLQNISDRKFNLYENRIFTQIFRNYLSSHREKHPSGILTPRTSNNQIFTSPGSKKMEDTKMSLLKPQLNDTFGNYNNTLTQTVYWAEVVHSHNLKDGPVSYMGRSGKENTPYLMEKNVLTNGDADPVLKSDKKMCFDQPRDKFSPRDSWKNRADDKSDSRDCSPDTWLKRKAESERSLPTNKKRPRDAAIDAVKESHSVNRITPSGGWLMGNSIFDDNKKLCSPPSAKKQEELKFPFRVSPPPPPDRPASPLPSFDDIDQPSTSSKETVAERNIRLDLERRIAERSPPERVVQRTSAGKVKGPFCTKGMNSNDSSLRRLSICDENEESPQARRKLSFMRPNGQDPESGDLVECPVCKCYFENCDINKHLDECVPSPIKKPDDGENDDEMACPICGLWQPKDTVATHADECAQKRYGA